MRKNLCTRLRALEQVIQARRDTAQAVRSDAAESIRARLMNLAILDGEVEPVCDSGISTSELRAEIAAIRAERSGR